MKVLIFGASGLYEKFKQQLNTMEIQIEAFVDNDIKKQGTRYDGKEIISADRISEYEYDYIVLTSSYWIQIEQQLLDMGIEKKRIVIPMPLGESYTESSESIESKIKNLQEIKTKKKISVISETGNDRFINRFFDYWQDNYEICSFSLDLASSRKYMEQIMMSSDLCFFEWAGEALAYGSNLAVSKEIPIVCRIHRYEVFGYNIDKINWNNVDRTVFIADHIRQLFLDKVNINKEKTDLIYNGYDFEEFRYENKKPGFKIAYLGAMIYRKAPEMLLQVLSKLVQIDRRYKLYYTGKFENEEMEIYFEYMINEMGMKENVIYDGYQESIDDWLDDKNYIICSSIGEGHIGAIQEAMIKGIKPIIHNYPGAKELYGRELLWNTIDEAVELITSSKYQSKLYRDIIYKDLELKNKAEEFDSLFRNILDRY